MFGATFLVPLLTGFPVSTTLLFSGIGTLLFLVITGNRLPSYLGSSFAFIAPILALGPGGGKALETGEQISQALLGVFVAGVLLAGIGFLVQATGTGWIEKLMPPVVSGAIVALIGLNLAPVAWSSRTRCSARSRWPHASCSPCSSGASSAASRSSSASSSVT